MPLTIASWNVNSVKARLPNLLRWLEEAAPDIVCLQELKCVDDAFPREPIEALGYHVETHGQKTYNGVALLAKARMEDVTRGLPNFADEQARYIEAVIPAGQSIVRVASIYLPNGNPTEGGAGEKYQYKLAFMDALAAHAKALLAHEEKCVLAGDYNVIPSAADVYNPPAWEEDALYRPETRAAFRRIVNLGYTEAIAARHALGGETYTFWDYQGGAWRKNNGIRIDHHLLSPQAADCLADTRIDRDTRDWEKPSDHVPVLVMLEA